MTKTEKLKQLGYTYDQKKYEWFKFENGFFKIIDLDCYNYKLDVGIIYLKSELKKALNVFDELLKDFLEVEECEDDD